jgi:Uma2 family endonuclease
MVAAAPLYPVDPPGAAVEQRILLGGVPWATYVMLRDSIESGAVKMTYLEGWLEIMSPSREHEIDKKQIARLVELFCLERDIPLFAYGSTTFCKEEKKRGLEPDECYSRGADKQIPDFALEVIKTHASLDKLEVYRGLGVREVWLYESGAFRVLSLRGDQYEAIPASEVLPELDLAWLAGFVVRKDKHAALREFRVELRR